MKIKDWIKALSNLGDEEKVVGDTFCYHNGGKYYDLTLALDGGEKEFYDATSTLSE